MTVTLYMIVEAIGLVVISIGSLMTMFILRNLLRRYEVFREQTAVMIAAHQDLLAGHEGRLQTLGSRGEPVPTAAELKEGRWRR